MIMQRESGQGCGYKHCTKPLWGGIKPVKPLKRHEKADLKGQKALLMSRLEL
jgi:hypothetical protein